MQKRLAKLDLSLLEHVESQTSSEDRRSLLTLHAAQQRPFRYLEIGSYLGGTLQSFLADPGCSHIVSIDRRDQESPDDRSGTYSYPGNTTANMLEALQAVPNANFGRLQTVDGEVRDLDPADFHADLCFVDGEHTHEAVLRDGRFCVQVLRGEGIVAFHDRPIIERGLLRLLREFPQARAYPLRHSLFVIELGDATALPRAREQLARGPWVAANRVGAAKLLAGLVARWRKARHGEPGPRA